MLCLHLQRNAAVIMRIRQPKTTARIFASGKMVGAGCAHTHTANCRAMRIVAPRVKCILCTLPRWANLHTGWRPSSATCLQNLLGAKSEEDARKAARKVGKLPQYCIMHHHADSLVLEVGHT